MARNGLEIIECERTRNGSITDEFLFCRDDIEDKIDDLSLCINNNERITFYPFLFYVVDCDCIENVCLKGINDQILKDFNIEVNCTNLELTLCPLRTFKKENIEECAGLQEKEVCSCILNTCGDFIDGGTFFMVLALFIMLFTGIGCFLKVIQLTLKLHQNVELKLWMKVEGKIFRHSLIALGFFFLLLFINISFQLRILFISKRRNYEEAAEIRRNLEFVIVPFVILLTLGAFTAIVQLERSWLELSWNTAKFFKWEKAELNIKYTKYILNFAYFLLFLAIVLSNIIVPFFRDNIKFDEGPNLVTSIVFFLLALFSFYVNYTFSSNLQQFAKTGSNNGAERIIKIVKRFCIVLGVCLVISAIGFMLDAFDVLDNANYAEADYSFLIQTLPLTLSTAVILQHMDKIIQNRYNNTLKT